MGKHKSHKSEKPKKSKKKHKSKRHYSSSDSSEDEWVEKKPKHSSSSSEEETVLKQPNKNSPKAHDREDWMNLPTSFLSNSNVDRRQARNDAKKAEIERKKYNPSECSRELNPYWKNGGDGLPKFQKPSENESKSKPYKSVNSTTKTSGWKKQSDPQTPPQVTATEIVDSTVVTEKQLNILAAKLVKAEIMGNTALIEQLKSQLSEARNNLAGKSNEEAVILTQTDSSGNSRPSRLQASEGTSSGHKRKKQMETHQDGERVRYFADDDKYNLKEMFENEKYRTIEDQNREFIEMSGTKVRKNDDLDDVFSDNIRKKESDFKTDSRNRDRAISTHQKLSRTLDNCTRCIQSSAMQKHLLIKMGETAFLALPAHEPLTEGHCLIVPIRHVSCATLLDENEWAEITDMRRALCQQFPSVVFFETAMHLFKLGHMVLECVPMPKEEGDMAPIYFKKAIDESETEWAQNKKLVSLKGRDVRRAVPKGLPYFSVGFGMDEGYAHVIEDEEMFPRNFAQEIIGGMLDLDCRKWKRPKVERFEEQSRRVLEFTRNFKDLTS